MRCNKQRDSITHCANKQRRQHEPTRSGLRHLLILTSLTWLTAGGMAGKAFAQESSGAQGIFLKMGIGARALAMGGAFTAVANDASATYWNPAGLDQLTRLQLEFMNVELPFDRRLSSMSAALPVRSWFTLGATWIGFRVSGIEGRSSNTEAPDYTFGNAQDALLLSASKSVGWGLAIGGTWKLVRSSLDKDSAGGMGFDAGVRVHLTDWLTLGALAQDLGTSYHWQNGLTEGVPSTMRLGASVTVLDGITVAADMSRTGSLALTPHLGLELRASPRLPFRFGFDSNSITGGAGYTFALASNMLELNYGFSSDRIANDAIHRFSVIFSLGAQNSRSHSKLDHNRDLPGSERTFSAQAPVARAVVIAMTLNIRSGPGTGYKRIATVHKGFRFTIVDRSGNWLKLHLPAGQNGWVHSRYVISLRK